LEVKGVIEHGDRLDLEVELVARAGCCPRCGRGSIEVKERPVVRVRDLPIAGRVTHLVWRKRRYRCGGCGRTFTETHPELPGRQRVTRRFRRRLFERVRGGAAHVEVARCEQTTRYQVARAFRAGAGDELAALREGRPARRLSLDEAKHRRGRELATVVSDLDCGASSRCSTAAHGAVWSATYARCQSGRGRRSRSSRSTPTRPTARRSTTSCRGPGSWSTTSTSCAAPTRHSTRSGASASARPAGGVRRALAEAAAEEPGAATSTAPATGCSRRASGSPSGSGAGSCELFEHEPLIAEAWGLKEAFRSIYKAPDRRDAERRLDHFLAAVERAQLAAFTAFADGIRLWREELLAYFDEPTTNGYAEGVINKVKVIKRRAYGLPTFNGFRDRVLLACG
jgi:transposase